MGCYVEDRERHENIRAGSDFWVSSYNVASHHDKVSYHLMSDSYGMYNLDIVTYE